MERMGECMTFARAGMKMSDVGWWTWSTTMGRLGGASTRRWSSSENRRRWIVMGAYGYAHRDLARSDPTGKINKDSGEQPDACCRLVSQGRGLWERRDELFAGTPSRSIVKLLLPVASEADLWLMILGVKRALLYENMRRSVYIELPRQDLRHGDGQIMWKLRIALYGIWADIVRVKMFGLCFSASSLHPSVCWYFSRCKSVDFSYCWLPLH